MTLEQLFSKDVMNWISEAREKNPNISAKELKEKFQYWFDRNKDSITLNESISKNFDKYKQPHAIFEAIGDDEEEEETPIENVEKPKVTPKPKVSIVDDEEEEEDTVTDDDDEIVKPLVRKSGTPIEYEDDEEEDDYEDEEVEDEEEEEPTVKKAMRGSSMADDDDETLTGNEDEVDGTVEIESTPITVATEDEEELVSKIEDDGGVYHVHSNEKSHDDEHNIFNVVNAWYNVCISEGATENKKSITLMSLLDTSNVSNMSALWAFADIPNLDLSGWDVENVKNMEGMFYKSTFDNPSIEDWVPCSCINFKNMFTYCKFSGNINGWTTGTTLEKVFKPDGRPNYIQDIDDAGNPKFDKDGKPILVPETKKVHVPIPKVGSRKVGAMDIKYDRIMNNLRQTDKVSKEMAEKKAKKTVGMSENRHVLTLDEFVNEGLYDSIKNGIKKGVKKIKEKISSIFVKMNDIYVAIIGNDGKEVDAISDYTTLNAASSGMIKGVTAFSSIKSPLLNNIEKTARIEDSNEKYGFIKTGSREYNNYLTFLDMLARNSGVAESYIDEAAVPLGKDGSGVEGAVNIDTEQLMKRLNFNLNDVPAMTQRTKSLATVIFGAPGIGKTTIPKTVISEYNKNHDKKKSLVVIECGDLELGGFYLPMPDETNMKNVIYANPNVRKQLKSMGWEDSKIDNLEGVRVLQTEESPKTWLPVYKPSSDNDTLVAQSILANTRDNFSYEWNDELKEFVPHVETASEGGILLFDEFLRADEELFKTIMQLVEKRETSGGYKLGSKWSILICSNRPCDDDEVKNRYKKLGGAFGNRFSGGIFNYIPDYGEWEKWARESGYFDEETLRFISDDMSGNEKQYDIITSGDVHKTITTFDRWHHLDPDEFKNQGKAAFPSPRAWDNLMWWAHMQMQVNGYSSIFQIPIGDLRNQAIAVLGDTVGDAYANHMKTQAKKEGKKPMALDFFTKPSLVVDTDVYGAQEAVKDIESYIKFNFKRDSIAKDKDSGNKFLCMAENLERLYGELGQHHLIRLHTNIVSNILQIRSKAFPEDKPLRVCLKPYLVYVGSTYGTEYADMA